MTGKSGCYVEDADAEWTRGDCGVVIVVHLMIIVFVGNGLPLRRSMRRIDHRTPFRILLLLWAGQARVKYTEGSEV